MKASYNNGVYSPKRNWEKPYNGKTEILSIMGITFMMAVIIYIAIGL